MLLFEHLPASNMLAGGIQGYDLGGINRWEANNGGISRACERTMVDNRLTGCFAKHPDHAPNSNDRPYQPSHEKNPAESCHFVQDHTEEVITSNVRTR